MKVHLFLFMILSFVCRYTLAGEADHLEKKESARHRGFAEKKYTVAQIDSTCIFQHYTSPDGPTPKGARKLIVRTPEDLLEQCRKLETNACPGGVVLGGHAIGNMGTGGLLYLETSSTKTDLRFFPQSKTVRQEMVSCFKRISKPLAEGKVPLTFASCTCSYPWSADHYDFISHSLAKDLGVTIRTSRGSNSADWAKGAYAVAEYGWSWSYPDKATVHCEDGKCWSWKPPR